MNDQLGIRCAWLPTSYQDRGNMGTARNDLNTRFNFAYGFDTAAPVQKKLTSAALRSPVLPTRRLNEPVHSSQDRIGEMPKPTAQGYEQRSLHNAFGYNPTFPPAVPRALYKSTEVETLMYARQTLSHQLQPTTPTLSVQEQWSNLWRSGRGTYDQPPSNTFVSRPAAPAPPKLGPKKTTAASHPLDVESGATSTRPTWSQVTGAAGASNGTKKWELQRAVQPPPRTLPLRKQRSLDHIEETSTDGGDPELPRTKANNATKLLSDSLAFSISAVNYPPARSTKFPVIKISNIPWSISIQEIEQLFSYVNLPDQQQIGQCIHVLINKSTGKTQSEAYIEVATEHDAYIAVKHFPHTPVKGRKLYIAKSSQEKLFQKIFPQWKGTFMDGRPFFLNDRGKAVDITTMTPPPLVERQEFESTLAICRNYKLHFSRKCGERPFESLISIMVKFPWDRPNIITTMQRDHLYEYFKLATGVLHNHLLKSSCTLDKGLMQRMVHAALTCPGLTVPQKKGILTASGEYCPENLVHFIEPLEDSSGATEDEDDSILSLSRLHL
ncbi:hypothetical protein BJV82DRAFT_656768 [Fennellomyces sp. T-0311]|nr:hypothetical protein BJV82DRAFT_656768 [Fennellomyces sp. T-0311]